MPYSVPFLFVAALFSPEWKSGHRDLINKDPYLSVSSFCRPLPRHVCSEYGGCWWWELQDFPANLPGIADRSAVAPKGSGRMEEGSTPFICLEGGPVRALLEPKRTIYIIWKEGSGYEVDIIKPNKSKWGEIVWHAKKTVSSTLLCRDLYL